MTANAKGEPVARFIALPIGRPGVRRSIADGLTQGLRVGGRRVPLWALALGFVFTGLAAGQAVGPVMQAASGVASLTVGRAVVFDARYDIEDTSLSQGLTPFDAFVAALNDEATAFTVALETHVGQVGEFNVPLENRTDQAVVLMLDLDVPPQVSVELDSDLDVRETKASAHTWLLEVGPNEGNVYVTVEYRDRARPGFIEITGRLVTVAP